MKTFDHLKGFMPTPEGMTVTAESKMSGDTNTIVIPGLTNAMLMEWASGTNIQDAMPDLSADHREFLMTGTTPSEWVEMEAQANHDVAWDMFADDKSADEVADELDISIDAAASIWKDWKQSQRGKQDGFQTPEPEDPIDHDVSDDWAIR